MSDELVERLLDWPYQGETMAEEAAVLIKQLTAERDHAWAMVAKADTQVGQSLADHMQAMAERDRLREALEHIISDCEADYPPSHGAIKYAAKLALKGETP